MKTKGFEPLRYKQKFLRLSCLPIPTCPHLVTSARFELALKVSKTSVLSIILRGLMVPISRIELDTSPYQGLVLPLYYIGIGVEYRTRTYNSKRSIRLPSELTTIITIPHWWKWKGSNLQQTGYEPDALPLNYISILK